MALPAAAALPPAAVVQFHRGSLFSQGIAEVSAQAASHAEAQQVTHAHEEMYTHSSFLSRAGPTPR